MKERFYYLDVIRILACIMVIAMHAPLPASRTVASDTYLLAPLSYLEAPCIGLFYMVSGALLLPIKGTFATFLKRRFTKILYPTILWSFLSVIIHCFYISNAEIGPYLRKSTAGLLFSAQGHYGVFWFMYTLAGLYLAAPILSKWWENVSKREAEFYLCIWLLTMYYPYIHLICNNISNNETNILYYFSGYIGYFILGAYLHKYGKTSSKLFRFAISGIVVCSIILPGVTIITVHEIDFYSLFWYLSVSVAMMCIGYFVIIQRVDFFNKSNMFTEGIGKLARLSFGIYLVHIFILREFLWNIDAISFLPYVLQIPVLTILTFGLSWGITALLSKLPFSKYIIGC